MSEMTGGYDTVNGSSARLVMTRWNTLRACRYPSHFATASVVGFHQAVTNEIAAHQQDALIRSSPPSATQLNSNSANAWTQRSRVHSGAFPVQHRKRISATSRTRNGRSNRPDHDGILGEKVDSSHRRDLQPPFRELPCRDDFSAVHSPRPRRPASGTTRAHGTSRTNSPHGFFVPITLCACSAAATNCRRSCSLGVTYSRAIAWLHIQKVARVLEILGDDVPQVGLANAYG